VVNEKSATVEPAATVAQPAPVANNAAVADNSSVENNAAVENNATAADNTTGALFGGSKSATVANSTTVNHPPGPTVASFATVAETAPVELNPTVAKHAPVDHYSTVEQNATVAPRRTVRLRSIQRITDGLTPGQYSVYSLMFERGEARTQTTLRLFRGGYVDLVRLTGLSKRGIQNVIAELQAKFVISIHQAPGYHRSQTTIYEVPAEQTILDRWFSKGLRYASGKSKNLVTSATVE
jgi:carbonic anhydrase/acetyltransferase-like protein (isoleucine patch superfamily)